MDVVAREVVGANKDPLDLSLRGPSTIDVTILLKLFGPSLCHEITFLLLNSLFWDVDSFFFQAHTEKPDTVL